MALQNSSMCLHSYTNPTCLYRIVSAARSMYLRTFCDKSEKRIPRRILKRLAKLNEGETKYEITYKSRECKDELSNRDILQDSMLTDKNASVDFPSDVKGDYNPKQRQDSQAYRPRHIKPSTTNIVLFPGQGSQFVGMGRQLLPYPGVTAMYEQASTILGYNLLDICLKGPKKMLDKTVYCQPAIFVTSLAALIKLRELHPEVEERCIGTSGFSIGEIAALVFAEAISFEEALQLVKVRAEGMQLASEEAPSGMMTVFCYHDTRLKLAVHSATEYCRTRLQMEAPVCSIANYLFPECKVVAGHNQALEFIEMNAETFKIRRMKRLPVSGAFHTALMAPARPEFTRKLRTLDIRKPSIPVHCNVTGGSYRGVQDILKILPKQLIKPVKWEQIMHVLYSRDLGTDFPRTFEIGPGNGLGILLKKVNAKAAQSLNTIDV